jgi:porphobilinogen synthase
MELLKRPRRLRKSPAVRSLVQETRLHPSNFITPFFLLPGHEREEPIEEMPGVARLSIDIIIERARELHDKGVTAILLFPCIDDSLKDLDATEAFNADGSLPHAVRILKKELPTLSVITDIALDLYTSHGHDGLLIDDTVDNDLSIEALKTQALMHAKAGVDFVAPSDMMDGRIGEIRKHLDSHGFTDVGILSYAAKYASAFYRTYRSVHNSAPRAGNKLGYQLSPANVEQALIEAKLDEEEGADLLMIKPASIFLDVVTKIKKQTNLPVGAFHVTGEYAMIMAADKLGYLDGEALLEETLLSIKRAGADFIVCYAYKFILSL